MSRAGAAALALAVGGLSACAPKAQAPAPGPLALDCARPFEAQAAAIAAQPGFTETKSPGEPYRYINAQDGRASYVITLPDAPAHPALVRQVSGPKGQDTTGCAYGDKPAYEQLFAYLTSLTAARRR